MEESKRGWKRKGKEQREKYRSIKTIKKCI